MVKQVTVPLQPGSVWVSVFVIAWQRIRGLAAMISLSASTWTLPALRTRWCRGLPLHQRLSAACLRSMAAEVASRQSPHTLQRQAGCHLWPSTATRRAIQTAAKSSTWAWYVWRHDSVPWWCMQLVSGQLTVCWNTYVTCADGRHHQVGDERKQHRLHVELLWRSGPRNWCYTNWWQTAACWQQSAVVLTCTATLQVRVAISVANVDCMVFTVSMHRWFFLHLQSDSEIYNARYNARVDAIFLQ